MIRIGIVVFENVEEMDAIGPWEVLREAARVSDNIECKMLAITKAPITAAKGLILSGHDTLDNVEALDLIIVPGGFGTRKLIEDDAFKRKLQPWLESATWVASVCTGSLLLASMGFLKNRKATTHKMSFNELERLDSTITVIKDQRYVQDDRVVTARGIAAGIDMALWFVSELADKELEQLVRHEMEYYYET